MTYSFPVCNIIKILYSDVSENNVIFALKKFLRAPFEIILLKMLMNI